MRSKQRLFLLLPVLAFLTFMPWLLAKAGWLSSADAQLIGGGAGNLLAALAGAVGAIWFQRQKEREDRIDSEASAINKAIFGLARRAVWLRAIKNQALDPHRDSTWRHLDIQPLIAPPPRVALPIDDLAPLLSSGAGNLLLKIAQEDVEFDAIISLIENRNTVHLEFQRLLGEQRGAGDSVTRDDLREMGLDRHYIVLEQATNDFYESVDAALPSHLDLIQSINKAALARYKGRKIIDFVLVSAGREADRDSED